MPSVRHFVREVQRTLGTPLLRINPREASVHGSVDIALADGALTALQGIAERLVHG